MMADKTLQEPTVPRGPRGPGPGRGHILICGVNPALPRRDGGEMVHCLGCWGRGRGKPLPRGLKPEGLKEEGLKTDIPR